MRTISDEWQVYLEKVVPTNASDTQVKETRYAFIAGAYAFSHLLQTQPDDDALACAADCEDQMALIVAQRLQRNE